MGYRTFSGSRIEGVLDGLKASAGYPFQLRHWVSASASNSFMGFQPSGYATQAIYTGFFRPFPQAPEELSIGGTLPRGEVLGILPIQPDQRDTIIWRGVHYQVEGTPVLVQSTQQWAVSLKRG